MTGDSRYDEDGQNNYESEEDKRVKRLDKNQLRDIANATSVITKHNTSVYMQLLDIVNSAEERNYQEKLNFSE